MSDTDLMTSDGTALTHILEAALLAADEPLSQARLASLFPEDARPSNQAIGKALEAIGEACENRGVELREVASGFRLQVKNDLQPWVARLWTEKPQKYSRAMLETLALIAYRQPITRGEIESVRGVSLSSNIIRSLQEREWIRIVGHRDVPGKPALFGTTKAFLDYFDLKSLDELPTLAEIKDMDTLEPELEFDGDGEGDDTESDGESTVTATAATAQGDDRPGSGEARADGEAARTDDSETAAESAEPFNAMDDDAGDDDLDEAFAELDSAFVTADSIDLGEDDPEADAGVDPDSPQGDLVAESGQTGQDETVEAGGVSVDDSAINESGIDEDTETDDDPSRRQDTP